MKDHKHIDKKCEHINVNYCEDCQRYFCTCDYCDQDWSVDSAYNKNVTEKKSDEKCCPWKDKE